MDLVATRLRLLLRLGVLAQRALFLSFKGVRGTLRVAVLSLRTVQMEEVDLRPIGPPMGLIFSRRKTARAPVLALPVWTMSVFIPTYELLLLFLARLLVGLNQVLVDGVGGVPGLSVEIDSLRLSIFGYELVGLVWRERFLFVGVRIVRSLARLPIPVVEAL